MTRAPYGQWISPLTAEMLCGVTKSSSNCDIAIDGACIYWTEGRPAEKGRSVLIQWSPEHGSREITLPEYDVRSKVHEYGGLAYAVEGELLYFIQSKDQRIYKFGNQNPLTPLGLRFADLKLCPQGLIAVCEEHRNDEVINSLVLINRDTGAISTLDAGHDFYASPSIDADNSKLAWLTWDHPQMPWDGTELWVADFAAGKLINKKKVAGSSSEAIFQPQWSPEGKLIYISDKEGWWNFYNSNGEALYPLEAEFALPLWRLGYSTWGFTGKGEEIFCAYQQKGIFKLALLNPKTKRLKEIDLKATDYTQIKVGKGFAIFLMGSPTMARRIVRLNLTNFTHTFLDQAEEELLPRKSLSIAEAIEFPTTGGGTAHAFFYPPKNTNFLGLEGEKPPLMVLSHGGPTGNVNGTFNLKMQYWTNRGFAVLDVNYRGSSGYGRAYRDALKGNWGLYDVQDCVAGAHYLAQRGDVDPKRCVIRGGSAGGYTTLAALAFTKAFRAGASYYGVADLELLARDTHKFEARYLDTLVGPYPARLDLYEARSPLKHAEKISCPVIFFQGGKDKVVPPNQAETMAQALKKNGIPTELILYPEEEHGFRQKEAMRDSLEKELKFYLEVFRNG